MLPVRLPRTLTISLCVAILLASAGCSDEAPCDGERGCPCESDDDCNRGFACDEDDRCVKADNAPPDDPALGGGTCLGGPRQSPTATKHCGCDDDCDSGERCPDEASSGTPGGFCLRSCADEPICPKV